MALLVVSLVVLSGCSGDTTTVYRASPAVVENATAADAGYATAGTRNLTVNETIRTENGTHRFALTNYVTHYSSTPSLEDGDVGIATFTVVSSPNVTLGNVSLNPLAYANHTNIVTLFETNATGLTVTDRVGTRDLTVLGNRTNLTTYEGQIELGNESRGANATIDVLVHVARFGHADDQVAVVAVHPQSAEDESADVVAMLRALEHPAPSATDDGD